MKLVFVFVPLPLRHSHRKLAVPAEHFGGELVIAIAGTRGDWPGDPRTLAPREPTREPNGTLW